MGEGFKIGFARTWEDARLEQYMEQGRVSIVYAKTAEEVRLYMEQGRIPVECAFGAESVVDAFELDHHGKYSSKPAVAVQAAEIKAAQVPVATKFVVTGDPDLDAVFAIAVLSGGLQMSEEDMNSFAKAIGEVDTDPTNFDWKKRWAREIAYFEKKSKKEQSSDAFWENIKLLKEIVEHQVPEEELDEVYEDFIKERETPPQIDEFFGDKVAFVNLKKSGADFSVALKAYKVRPAIVVLMDTDAIVVGIKDDNVAKEFLGEGGLKNLWPILHQEVTPEWDPKQSWGGRESAGGSPRGRIMSLDEAYKTCQIVEGMLK